MSMAHGRRKRTDVLIYQGKYDEGLMYDVSTPAKEAAAFLLLFEYLDSEWGMYSDIEEPEALKTCEPCAKELHRLCEGGCACEGTPECKKRARSARNQHGVVKAQKELYDKAKDPTALPIDRAAAAKRLLNARRKHEYEDFQEGSVIDPLEEPESED